MAEASEINSLCFSAGATGHLLVLFPADERVGGAAVPRQHMRGWRRCLVAR